MSFITTVWIAKNYPGVLYDASEASGTWHKDHAINEAQAVSGETIYLWGVEYEFGRTIYIEVNSSSAGHRSLGLRGDGAAILVHDRYRNLLVMAHTDRAAASRDVKINGVNINGNSTVLDHASVLTTAIRPGESRVNKGV